MRRRVTAAFLIALGVLALGVTPAGAWTIKLIGPSGQSRILNESDLGAPDLATNVYHIIGQRQEVHVTNTWWISSILAHNADIVPDDKYVLVSIGTRQNGPPDSVLKKSQLGDDATPPMVWVNDGALDYLREPFKKTDHNGDFQSSTKDQLVIRAVKPQEYKIELSPTKPVKGKTVTLSLPGFDEPDYAPDLLYSWTADHAALRDTGDTATARFHDTGKLNAHVTVTDVQGTTLASGDVNVRVGKPSPVNDNTHDSSTTTTPSPSAGAGTGAGTGTGTGYSAPTYGTSGYTPPVAGVAAVTPPATPMPQPTTATPTPTVATPAPTPTPAPAPTAAFNALLGAPNPPLSVTTADPVVSGELLSGPNAKAAAAAAAAAAGGGGTGTGTVTTPATPVTAIAQPTAAAQPHDDSGFSIPNAAWEIALLLLLVGIGWWAERRNASAPPTVSLP